MPLMAETALSRAQDAITRGTYDTIGAAINGASPHYSMIEKLDGIYRIYWYQDKSYIMTYIDPKKQQAWIPAKA